MRWTRLARNMFLGVSLVCLGLPEAEALEIFSPPSVAAQMDDGLITQVRGGRGGGGHARTEAEECIAAGAECTAAVGRIAVAGACIAAEGRIAVAALTVGAPIAAAPIVAGRPTVGARTAAAPIVAGRPIEAALIVGGSGGVSRRRLSLWRLDSSRVRLGAWRRHRGRRGAWLCQRGGGGVLGRRCSGARPLLVLHRPEPAAGLLGRLPVSRQTCGPA